MDQPTGPDAHDALDGLVADAIHVTVIASSVAPLRQYLQRLPACTGMIHSVMLVGETPLRQPLSEVLAASCAMPVRVAEPGLMLLPDRIHVILPCAVLALREGRLAPPQPASAPRSGWDAAEVWLRALAIEAGARTWVVLLDGTTAAPAGAYRVASAGGRVLSVPRAGASPRWSAPAYEELPAESLVDRLLTLAGIDVLPLESPMAATPARLAQRRVGELVERIEELESLLHSERIGTVLLDAQLRVRWFSQAAQRYFNLLPQDVGRPIRHVSCHLAVDDLTDILQAVIDGGDAVEQPVRLRSGERQLLRVHPSGDPAHPRAGVVLTLVDIDAVKPLALHDSGSASELPSFAYAVSHDLQEPVRMIVSFSELLQRRYAKALAEVDDAEHYLAPIRDGAQRLRRMLDSILTYSRIDTRGAPLQRTGLNDVVEQALAPLAEQLAATGATLHVAPLPSVAADPVQLGWVFRELVQNALKFSADAPLQLRIDAIGDERAGWRIRICDNGIGIPPERAETVFHMFKRLQLKPGVEGQGAGLALAQRIVQRHGGRMQVEPGVDGGCCIVLALPPTARAQTGEVHAA